MSKLITALLLFLTGSPYAVQAQESKTVSIRFERTTGGGELVSCSLGFTVLGNDFRYKDGGIISATGNFSLFRTPDSPNGPVVFGFKLTVYDYVLGELIPARIAQTHLAMSNGGVWKSKDRFIFDGELPGSRLHTLFLGDESEVFFGDILKTRKFSFGFNRDVGSSDVMMTVDTRVVSVDQATGAPILSDEPFNDFSSCLRNAINMSIK